MREAIKIIFFSGWTNFRRNSYVSFGTTGVMMLVLLVLLSLLVFNFMAAQIVVALQEKVDISVYFKMDASEEEIGTVRSDLQQLSDVKAVQYISREKALSDFRERHAGDALIQESLAELDFNPLQASLNIKAVNSTQYASIVNFIEENKFRPLIDKINYYENEQVISRIQSISDALQNWGFLATIVLTAISILVTFNTIRLTIYNQKQEIEIMRLVGASNWHIRAPYVVEGGLYGLFAGILALAVFYPTALWASPKVADLMPGLDLWSYLISHIHIVIALVFGFGILLGGLSSVIAIRRFLKI